MIEQLLQIRTRIQTDLDAINRTIDLCGGTTHVPVATPVNDYSLVKAFQEGRAGSPNQPSPLKEFVDRIRPKGAKTPNRKKAYAESNGTMTVVAAFREVIPTLGATFINEHVRVAALKAHPEIAQKIENATAVTLKFLRKSGEIEIVEKNGRHQVWRMCQSNPSATLAAIKRDIRQPEED